MANSSCTFTFMDAAILCCSARTLVGAKNVPYGNGRSNDSTLSAIMRMRSVVRVKVHL